MKKVHKADMVAHLWANQSQAEARNPQGNFYFDGPTLYSYGSHFIVGKLIERKGRKAALLNSRTYSVTTSKHQRLARYALLGGTLKFRVPDTAPHHASNIAAYKVDIAVLTGELARTRKASYKKDRIADIQRLTAEANNYRAFFGLHGRFKTPKFSLKYLAEIEADVRADNERKAAAEKVREAKLLAESAEAIAEWRTGAKSGLPYGVQPYLPGAMLRVKDEVVQTSRGAEVPVADARRAIAFIADIRAKGETWKRNGERFPVGQFQLDSVTAGGDVNAGCHFIEWAEVVRLADTLGVPIAG